MKCFVTRVSDYLQEEYHLGMLNENMNIFISWFMLTKWMSQGLRGRV